MSCPTRLSTEALTLLATEKEDTLDVRSVVYMLARVDCTLLKDVYDCESVVTDLDMEDFVYTHSENESTD